GRARAELTLTPALSLSEGEGAADPLRGGLFRGRPVAHQGGAPHVARFVRREGARAVHGLAVVPHHEVAHRPLVRVDELTLRGMLHEVAQKAPRLWHGPAHDPARV